MKAVIGLLLVEWRGSSAPSFEAARQQADKMLPESVEIAPQAMLFAAPAATTNRIGRRDRARAAALGYSHGGETFLAAEDRSIRKLYNSGERRVSVYVKTFGRSPSSIESRIGKLFGPKARKGLVR